MPKTCLSCNSSIAHLRADAKYCSDTCRTIAYRERRGIVTRKPPQEAVCQYAKCGKPIIGRRSDARFCSSNCQKLSFHFKKEAKINMIIEMMRTK